MIFNPCGEELLHCVKCKELAGFRSQVVPANIVSKGVGDKPLIMYVARNPGRTEDAEGEPLIGRAGKVLREITEPYYDRAMFVWNNMVKCWTPGDREPYQHEIDNCKPYIEREIDVAEPDAIVYFGLMAQESAGFKKEERHSLRAITRNYRPILLTSTYHPSYAARGNKEARQRIATDIGVVVRAAELLKSAEKRAEG